MEGGWEEWLLVGGDKRESEQREPIPVDHRSIGFELQAYQFQVLRGTKRT